MRKQVKDCLCQMRGTMKRKYYLRGLGIGILVTAFILGITANKSKAMTDEEVMARARELGMVENTVLSNIGSNHSDTEPTDPQSSEPRPEGDSDQTELKAQPEGDPDQAEPKPQPEGDPDQAEPKPQPEDASDQTMPEPQPEDAPGQTMPEPQPEENPDQTISEPQPEETDQTDDDFVQTTPETDGQTITLTIRRGESSSSVSRMLAEAGLVENASAYDRYLCSNGYDKRIRTGTYEIPIGATEEEIARIISGGN